MRSGWTTGPHGSREGEVTLALTTIAALLCACTPPTDEPPETPVVESEEPLPEGFDDLRRELAEIDPDQADRRDRPVLYDVENTCADLERGEEDDIVLKHVEGRFDVDTPKAEKILAAIKEHIC